MSKAKSRIYFRTFLLFYLPFYLRIEKTKETRINIKKTNKIMIAGKIINIDTFQELKYLGSKIEKYGGILEDVKNKITNSTAYGTRRFNATFTRALQ